MSWECRRVGSVSISMDVPEIVGKGRPRFTRGGKPYTPRKTVKAERAIREKFREVAGARWSKFGGPVSIQITYARELAKSNPKFWSGRRDTGKPDLDNVSKLVLDALNGLAFIDDQQVAGIVCLKGSRRPHGEGSHLDVLVTYYSETYRKE